MACIKQVEHLPESIVEHPHLRDATELDLSGGARLVVLPEGFEKLTNLKSLNLCAIWIATLPEGKPFVTFHANHFNA